MKYSILLLFFLGCSQSKVPQSDTMYIDYLGKPVASLLETFPTAPSDTTINRIAYPRALQFHFEDYELWVTPDPRKLSNTLELNFDSLIYSASGFEALSNLPCLRIVKKEKGTLVSYQRDTLLYEEENAKYWKMWLGKPIKELLMEYEYFCGDILSPMFYLGDAHSSRLRVSYLSSPQIMLTIHTNQQPLPFNADLSKQQEVYEKFLNEKIVCLEAGRVSFRAAFCK